MSASVVAAQGRYSMTGEPTFDREYKRLADDYVNDRCAVSPDEAAPLLEKYPYSPYVWRLSSDLLLRAGRFKEALNACQTAFERLSTDDSSLERSLVYCKFRSLVGLGLYADARAVLDRAIDKFPGDGLLYSARATVNECLGYNLQAEDDYGSAISFSPGKEDNYVHMANLMIKRGKDEEAAELMKKNGGNTMLAEAESRFRLGRGEIPEAVSCFFFAAKNSRVDPLAAERMEKAAPGYFKWALAANRRNLTYQDEWLVDLMCSQLARKGRAAEALDAFKACLADNRMGDIGVGRCVTGELSSLLHLRRFSELDAICDLETETDTFLVTSPLLVSAVKRNMGKEMPGFMGKLDDLSCGDRLEAMLRSGDETVVAASVAAAARDVNFGRGSAGVYALRAQANESLGRHGEAVADANESLRLYDRRNSPEARLDVVNFAKGGDFLDLCDSVSNARAALLSLAVLREEGARAEAVVREALDYGINRDELLYAAACLRSRQGRGAEAVGLLESAIEAGFYDIEWLRRAPLLAEARKEPAFDELMKSYAVADAKKPVKTSAVSVACDIKADGVAHISGSVSGLPMEVVYDPTMRYNFMSKSAADFLEKNGMLTVMQSGSDKAGLLKEVDLGGGVVLRNVLVWVYDLSVPVVISSRPLLKYGLPKVDKAQNRLTLTRVDF